MEKYKLDLVELRDSIYNRETNSLDYNRLRWYWSKSCSADCEDDCDGGGGGDDPVNTKDDGDDDEKEGER